MERRSGRVCQRGLKVLALALGVMLLGSSNVAAQTKMHLGIIQSVTALPLFWLQEQDLKKEYGIDLKITVFARPTEMYTSFKGKRTDGSYIGIVTAYNFMEGGVPVNLIRPWIYPRQFGIIVKKDAPFKTLQDLRGRTFATPSISGTEYILSRLAFQIVGVDLEKELKVSSSAPAASIGAIGTNKLDSTIIWHPSLAKALATGEYRILAKPQDLYEQKYGGLFPQFGIGFHRDYYEKNRAALKSFVKALDTAIARTYSHPDEVDAIGAKKLDLDMKTMKEIRAYFGDAWLRTGLDDKVLKQTQDFYKLVKDLGFIKEVPNAKDIWTLP